MSLTAPKVDASTATAGSATYDIAGIRELLLEVELGGGTSGAVPTVGLSFGLQTHSDSGGTTPITPDVDELAPGRRRLVFRELRGEKLAVAWFALSVSSGSPTITIRDRSR